MNSGVLGFRVSGFVFGSGLLVMSIIHYRKVFKLIAQLIGPEFWKCCHKVLITGI